MKKIVLLLMLFWSVSACAEQDYSQYYFTVTTTKEVPLSPEQNTTTQETSKKVIFLNKIYEELSGGEGPGGSAYVAVTDGKYELESDQKFKLSFEVSQGLVKKLKITPPLKGQINSINSECLKSSFLYKFINAYKNKETKVKYYLNNGTGANYTENIAVFKFPDENKIRVMSFWPEGIDDHLYNTKSVLKLDESTKQKQDNGTLIPLQKADPQDQGYLEIADCVATYYKDADYFNK